MSLYTFKDKSEIIKDIHSTKTVNSVIKKLFKEGYKEVWIPRIVLLDEGITFLYINADAGSAKDFMKKLVRTYTYSELSKYPLVKSISLCTDRNSVIEITFDEYLGTSTVEVPAKIVTALNKQEHFTNTLAKAFNRLEIQKVYIRKSDVLDEFPICIYIEGGAGNVVDVLNTVVNTEMYKFRYLGALDREQFYCLTSGMLDNVSIHGNRGYFKVENKVFLNVMKRVITLQTGLRYVIAKLFNTQLSWLSLDIDPKENFVNTVYFCEKVLTSIEKSSCLKVAEEVNVLLIPTVNTHGNLTLLTRKVWEVMNIEVDNSAEETVVMEENVQSKVAPSDAVEVICKIGKIVMSLENYKRGLFKLATVDKLLTEEEAFYVEEVANMVDKLLSVMELKEKK